MELSCALKGSDLVSNSYRPRPGRQSYRCSTPEIPLLHKEAASNGAIPPQGCRELCCRRAVVERVYWSQNRSQDGLGKFPEEAAMNDAIHQLIQVILQGV